MTLVRWNNQREMPRGYRHHHGDLLMNRLWNDRESDSACHTPPANILEMKDSFHVELSVPGYAKKDFSIQVENRILTIEGRKEESSSKESIRVNRQEFATPVFKRSFKLSDWVDSEGIKAKYEHGILQVSIPKKEEAKTKPAREIEIK